MAMLTEPSWPPAMSDPPIPPSDGRCLLLELPRELRDMIYEFALSRDGLIFRGWKDDGFPAFSAPNWRNTYQLKYACRQLLYEAPKCELEINDLIFPSNATGTGLENFIQFLTVCSPKWKNRTKKIIFHETAGPPSPMGSNHLFWDNMYTSKISQKLRDFSIANPKCRILLHHPLLENRPRVYGPEAYSITFRHFSNREVLPFECYDRFMLRHSGNSPLRCFVTFTPYRRNLAVVLPSNLRAYLGMQDQRIQLDSEHQPDRGDEKRPGRCAKGNSSGL